jgi:PAS domain S-box-containing protein
MKRAAGSHLPKMENAIPLSSMPIEAPLRHRVALGMIAGVLVTGCMGFFSWHSVRVAEEDADWVAHSHAVMDALDVELQHVIEVETSSGTFALTGQDRFLADYETARGAIAHDEYLPRHLTEDNPKQQHRLDVLDPQIRAAIGSAAGLVAKRQQMHVIPDASDMRNTDKLTDSVRATIQDMRAEETQLLAERVEKTDAARRLAYFIIVAGTLLGTCFLILAWFGINRQIDVSEKASAEIGILNAELEERVVQRTRELKAEIGERKLVEEARVWLAAAVESSDDAIISKTLEGKITAWNRGAEKLFGYSASEVVGKPLPNLFPPERANEESDILARMGRGERIDHFETVRVRKDGSRVDVFVTMSPIKDDRGIIVGASKIARDITQRKAAEDEIRSLNNELERRVIQRTAELEATNKELEAFTYSVSHDLRAPLRHIGGFSKILVEEFGSTLDPQARQHLQRIQDGTLRMGQLVDELLNLARVGRHELRLQITGLNSIVQEVMSILKGDSAGRNVEWKIADLPFIDCDPVLVKQVFQNLMANALKFTRRRERAVIEIGPREENGQTAIMIRDNGVGFSMKYADKLFGVFQRLHRPEDFEGTGIGLVTVQRIVQKHGGRVWAEAELDKGATFYFTLGAAEQGNRAAAQRQQIQSSAPEGVPLKALVTAP